MIQVSILGKVIAAFPRGPQQQPCFWLTALAACSVGGAGGNSFTGEKNSDRRMAERSQPVSKLATTPRGDDSCKSKETLFAHVDDDRLRDRVYHDWIRKGAALGVCTGDRRTDPRPGAGMSELLRIIDVQNDGRDEILFGGTSILTRFYDVALGGPKGFKKVVGLTLSSLKSAFFLKHGGNPPK